MNKSVYSLVLSDEIVQEIDRLAYEMGQSRSAMVNQVLADYVRYTTPEKRMREVFSAIEQMLIPPSTNGTPTVSRPRFGTSTNRKKTPTTRQASRWIYWRIP